LLDFEHIVQINDPDDDSIKPLSRQQLWEGLLLRAKDPGKFNNGLFCRLDEVAENSFVRYIQAGDTEFREQVSLTYQENIETKTVGVNQSIHAESVASIEEPASGYLFVRFIYRRDIEDSKEGALIGEHLKSAYVQLDIDAIALIRMLAEDKLLVMKVN
jgi:hypothetical protein